MDKASILGDTIEYVKQLRKKIQELEIHAWDMEAERNNSKRKLMLADGSSGDGNNGGGDVEGRGVQQAARGGECEECRAIRGVRIH